MDCVATVVLVAVFLSGFWLRLLLILEVFFLNFPVIRFKIKFFSLKNSRCLSMLDQDIRSRVRWEELIFKLIKFILFGTSVCENL